MRSFFLLIATVLVLTPLSDLSADTMSDRLEELRKNFILIPSGSSQCSHDGKISNGSGFIIGEDADYIYAVSPWHVLHQEIDNSTPNKNLEVEICRPNSVNIVFHYQKRPLMLAYDFEVIDIIPTDAVPIDDVHFIKLPKPNGWVNGLPEMASNFSRGDVVSYIGYKGKPTAPLSSGQVLDSCERDVSASCSLWVEGMETQRGESGAMLFNAAGQLVGMNIIRQEKNDIRAIRIDEIRKLAEGIDLPWNIYRAAETVNLGKQLNAAIQAGDIGKIDALFLKYFDMDRKFDHPEPDRSDEFPINLAARRSQFDIVNRMIDLGVTQATTSALIAIGAGDETVAQNVVTRGLNARCILFYAIHDNAPSLVDLILDRQYVGKTYNINELCLAGDTSALYEAIFQDQTETALGILDLGADPNVGHIDRVFYKGFPLSLAILNGQRSVVRALLDNNADVDRVSYRPGLRINRASDLHYLEFFGPMHAAAAVGDIDLIDEFVLRGGDPDVHRTVSQGQSVVGESPFEIALMKGQFQAAEHLLKAHSVSPFGYRYIGNLVEDTRRELETTAEKYRAESLIEKYRDRWCRALEKSKFDHPQDFFTQERQCR